MSTISKNYRNANTLTASRFSQSAAAPILLGVLFFFVLCLGAPDSIKGIAMIVAVASLLVTAVRFDVLRKRIRWPFVALTLCVLMDGISTFYAVSGKFALKEFLKVFLAYGMAVILLATSPKDEKVTGKRIATILTVCTAIGSLVSIDLISTRWISGAVTWVLGLFSEGYMDLEGVVPGTRITSLFTNSNIFAGFSGLGVVLSLGMADAAESKKQRYVFLCLLYINSLAFLLAISLGAILFEAVAFIAFLLMLCREKRGGSVVLILELLILAAAAMAVISGTSFQAWNTPRPIPLLCVVFGSALLIVLDSMIGQRIAARFHFRKKTAVTLVAVLVVIAAAYAVAALTITEEITVIRNNPLERSGYPDPGSYTLTVQADGSPLEMRIRSRSYLQTAMNEDTILYKGAAETATFVVPDDSVVVFFDFYSSGSTRIISAQYNGHSIPLRYKLLPSFVAYRLQGALASHSVAQRVVYFQDAYKLFRRSPVFGLGMGAFENAIKSVQSYYYETKYAHNHYFQSMLETGIVGLILFLGLLVSSAAAIWKSRKKHPYAPMLGAALLFMAGQAVHDIVFSAYAYLPIAYGTFAMIDLCCGEEIQKPKLTQTVKTIGIAVTAVCTIIYCGFLAGNMIAVKKIQDNPTMDTLVQCSRLDRFEWADYALPYIINVTGNESASADTRNQADAFARRLATVNSNTIPIYLAEYYFASERPEMGIAMLEKYVDYVASDQNAWKVAFNLIRSYDDGSVVYGDGVLRIAEKLETWNAENVGTVTLDGETNAYIAACRQ